MSASCVFCGVSPAEERLVQHRNGTAICARCARDAWEQLSVGVPPRSVQEEPAPYPVGVLSFAPAPERHVEIVCADGTRAPVAAVELIIQVAEYRFVEVLRWNATHMVLRADTGAGNTLYLPMPLDELLIETGRLLQERKNCDAAVAARKAKED